MDRIALAFSPLRDAPPHDILDWSRRAEALGFAGIFVPESFNDSLAYAQAVAAATSRAQVGHGDHQRLPAPSRRCWRSRRRRCRSSPAAGCCSGLGVGHRPVNASLGIDMGDPLAKIRDVIGTLRTAWVKGPHQPRPAAPPTILAAALARPMVELAGELADGVIFNLFPLERYRKAMAMLHRGAARGGRDPQSLEVCHFTTAYLGPDRAACLHEAKRMLARYANLPFYGNMLAQCGFADRVEEVRAHMKQRDVAKAELRRERRDGRRRHAGRRSRTLP